MRAHLLSRVVCLFAVGLPAIWGSAVRADDSPPAIRRIFVPADRPGDWPDGDWRPVPLADLEKYLKLSQTNAAPRPSLVRAEYSAVLVGSEWRSGRLNWSLSGSIPQAVVPLRTLNLAVTNLCWADERPAAWGVDAEGRVQLIGESGRDRLQGDWSLVGRRVGETLLFEVEVPKAIASNFALGLPPGWVVRSNVGDVVPPEGEAPAGETGWQIWTVRLGGHSRTQWTVSRSTNANNSPAVLVKQESEYRVRQDGFRFQTAIDLEVLSAPLWELALEVDPNLQVLAIATADGGGLSWRPGDSRGGIAVRFPEAILGAAPRLRIDAVGRVSTGRLTPLPQIRVANGWLLSGADEPTSGRTTVRVASPLQVQDLDLAGCRQIEMGAAGDEERFVFRQYDPHCRIAVHLDQAQWRSRARCVTHVQATSDAWIAQTASDWETVSGSAFSVSCRAAAGWDVVDVRTDEGAAEALQWQVAEDAGVQVLTVEFREPLTPAQRRRLIIDCRRSTSGGQIGAWNIPVVSPLNVASAEMLVGLSSDQPHLSTLASPGSFQMAEFPDSPVWKSLLTSLPRLAESANVWYRGRLPGTDATFATRDKPLDAQRLAGIVPNESLLQESQQSLPTGSPVVAELTLSARWVLDGADLYRARFDVRTDGRQSSFAWVLPQNVELLDLRLNGQRVDSNGQRVELQQAGQRSEIDLPAGRTRQQIELEYRQAVTELFGPERRPVQFPQPFAPVLKVLVQIESGSDTWLGDVEGLVRADQPDQWLRRLFGPLGRTVPLTGNGLIPRLAAADSPHPTRWAFGGDVPAGAFVSVWRASRRELAGWTALGLSAMATMLVRLSRIPQARLVLGIVAAGAMALCFVLPESVAPLAGAAQCGMWLAVFVPTRWLAQPAGGAPGEQAGSSRTSLAAGTLAGVALAMLAAAPEGRGQELADDPPRARIPVLIPVDARGLPVGEAPLAYVPPELQVKIRDALRGDSPSADWLLRRADYSLDASHRAGSDDSTRPAPPLIVAEYEVIVRPTDRSVSIALPIREAHLAGADACSVDGRPHPILRAADGGVVVVLSPPEGDATLSRDSWSVPAVHRIVLRLAAQPRPGAAELAIGVPAVPAAFFRARTAGDRGPLIVAVTPTGLSYAGKPGVDAPLTLGAASEIRLVDAQRTSPGSPADIETQSATVCDLHPGCVHFQTRLRVRVTRGELDSLTWALPERAVVRDVQGTDIMSTENVPLNGTRLAQIGFRRHLTGEFSLRMNWLIPRDRADPAIAFVSPTLSGPGTVLTTSQTWAWRQPSDRHVELMADPPDRARPQTVDQFLAVFPIAGARPAAAVELSDSVRWRLDARVLQPRILAASRQIVRVSRTLLESTFEAELTAQDAPVFQHRVAIPQEVAVDKVSVFEGETERLLRWSHSAGTLVIYLQDRAREQQRLRIVTSQPLAESGTHRLRVQQLQSEAAADPLVLLYAAPDAAVEVVGAGSALPVPVPAGVESPLASTFVGAFRAPPADPLLLRVTAAPSDTRVVRLRRLSRGPAGWSWTAQVELEVLAGQQESLTVRVPAALAEAARIVTTPPVRPVRQVAGDGSQTWTFIRNLPSGGKLSLNVTWPERASLEESRAVPALDVMDLALTQDLLAVPRDLARIDVRPAASGHAVQADDPALKTLRLPEGNWLVYSLEGAIESLGVAPADETERPATFVESAIWLGTPHVRGRTEVWLTGRLPNVVTLDWPESWTLDAVVIDGRVAPLQSPRSGRLQVPLQGGLSTRRRLELAWSAALGTTLAAGPLSMSLPGRLLESDEPAVVIVYPPPDADILTPRTGQTARFDSAIRRWEALLRGVPESPATDDEWSAAVRDSARRAVVLSRGVSLTGERFRRMQFDLQRTRAIDPKSDPDLFGDDSLPLPAGGQVLDGPAPQISLGTLAHSTLHRLGALTFALLTAVVVLLGSRLGGWIQGRPWACSLILGTFWSLALAPSWFGLIFPTIAAVDAIFTRQTTHSGKVA